MCAVHLNWSTKVILQSFFSNVFVEICSSTGQTWRVSVTLQSEQEIEAQTFLNFAALFSSHECFAWNSSHQTFCYTEMKLFSFLKFSLTRILNSFLKWKTRIQRKIITNRTIPLQSLTFSCFYPFLGIEALTSYQTQIGRNTKVQLASVLLIRVGQKGCILGGGKQSAL